jgi:hypothetical protein
METKAACVTMLAILVSTSPVLAHAWYQDLKTPNGLSCCNGGFHDVTMNFKYH